MKLTGTLQIQNWQESAIPELTEQASIKTALVKQSYSGDIKGTSTIKYQLCYDNGGNARFNGFEVIDAMINDTTFQLTLMHDGKFKQGTASSQFTVISSTPSGPWLNAKGEFHSTEGGQANYLIHGAE
ncbi:DUF3224 domain-containing protein [Pseudoalteromonas sp. T1lg65]|uniref:DUF3224 domain-containing protein n=1 Tax=Pseudoalteromonas sp. T1lg65 TaxID=2077101 RepID=UPI003F7A175C